MIRYVCCTSVCAAVGMRNLLNPSTFSPRTKQGVIHAAIVPRAVLELIWSSGIIRRSQTLPQLLSGMRIMPDRYRGALCSRNTPTSIIRAWGLILAPNFAVGFFLCAPGKSALSMQLACCRYMHKDTKICLGLKRQSPPCFGRANHAVYAMLGCVLVCLLLLQYHTGPNLAPCTASRGRLG